MICRKLNRQPNRRIQTPHIRLPRSRQIQRRAVIHRGADDRHAERDVDAAAEAGVFEDGEALVVVHGEEGVAVFQVVLAEHGVGGEGAGEVQAFVAQFFEHGDDGVDFFRAEMAAFAGVGVEAGDVDAGVGDAEAVDEVAVQDANG